MAEPLLKCPVCGQQQVLKNRKLSFEKPEALAKAFKNINLKSHRKIMTHGPVEEPRAKVKLRLRQS